MKNISPLIQFTHNSAIAMAPGCLIGGFVMQKYGRKFAHYFLCFPAIIGWLSIYLAENLTAILVGRFLTGMKNYVQFRFHVLFTFYSGFALGLLGPPGAIFIGETR